MTINPRYKIGEMVVLKHDPDNLRRQVISYTVNESSIVYNVQCGMEISSHSHFELIPHNEALAGFN
jgi:hypothetical protein